jgi:DNA ligase-1
MQRLAELCERIAATTKKTAKVALLAEYFRSRELPDAVTSAVFLSGRAFAAFDERTLQIGGSLLWKLVVEFAAGQKSTGAGSEKQILRGLKPARDDKNKELARGAEAPHYPSATSALTAAYRQRGDLGAAAYDVLVAKAPASSTITLQEVRATFDQIAETRTATAKTAVLKSLLERATALEAKCILKIIAGELRIGLKESLVEEAIAKAYDEPLPRVQRANMLLGDIGATLQLAAEHRLDDARLRLFHPIGFMLASPAADAEEAFQCFADALVEDKYDGIRAQAHCGGGQVRLFSRTLDEVTPSFPELVGPLSEFAGEVILDGEIVAWRDSETGGHGAPGGSAVGAMGWGHALPFGEIHKRLGRKQVSEKLIAEVPVAYVVFDVIYAGGELTLDKPLSERAQVLDRIFAGANRITPRPVVNAQGQLLFEAQIGEEAAVSGWVLRAPSMRADSAEQLEKYFEQAMARGNEGLMIKDLESPYMPGRRGRWWLKLKRELATLDVVVTAAEFGHGKRIHVLSDYTFAVRKGEELVNIGKAYSGLTDKEIAELTKWFLAHTTADHGHLREVEPKIVLEVAFNAIMRSDRHDSGFALRFPRIVRVRQDKLPEEIDTVEAVEQIYKRQHGR